MMSALRNVWRERKAGEGSSGKEWRMMKLEWSEKGGGCFVRDRVQISMEDVLRGIENAETVLSSEIFL